MHYLFPTNFVLLAALMTSIKASPTGTTPSPATKVLKTRKTLAGQIPSPAITLVAYSDSSCSQGAAAAALVYEQPVVAQAMSFVVSRNLTEVEQLDVSGAGCVPYIGAAVAHVPGAAATLVSALGPQWSPATGGVCYTVGSQAAGCFKLWNRNGSQ